MLSKKDFPSILTINHDCVPAVCALDTNELARLLSMNCIGFVAEDHHNVEGYLLAFRKNEAYDGEEFDYFKSHIAEDFLYIDQIAIAQTARRKGVGIKLYDAASHWAKKHGMQKLCCEVNLLPPNPQSVAFHTTIGFGSIGELSVSDGRNVTLLVKKL